MYNYNFIKKSVVSCQFYATHKCVHTQTKSKNIFSSKNCTRYYMHYVQHITHDFIYKKNIKNLLNIPKIEKIVLNMTDKNIVNDKKNIMPLISSLEIVSGQKLKYTSAHKSISTFKIRKKQIIGCKLDLRKKQMFTFLEKLITIILPRERNFTGINKSCLDSYGHLNVGLPTILNFPELKNYFEYFSTVKGVDITVVTKCKKTSNNKFIFNTLCIFSGLQIPIK